MLLCDRELHRVVLADLGVALVVACRADARRAQDALVEVEGDLLLHRAHESKISYLLSCWQDGDMRRAFTALPPPAGLSRNGARCSPHGSARRQLTSAPNTITFAIT